MGMNAAYDIFATYPDRHTEALVTAGALMQPDLWAEARAAGLDATWVLDPECSRLLGALSRSEEESGRGDLQGAVAYLEATAQPFDAERLSDLCALYVDYSAFTSALRRLRQGAQLRRYDLEVWRTHGEVFTTEPVTLSERLRRMEAGAARLIEVSARRASTLYGARDLARLAAEPTSFVPTGLLQLDRQIHGYMPGRVSILAGRPSHGKTTLALDLALRMARRAKAQVVYFSAEMSAQAVAYRLKANLARVNSRHLGAGRLNGSEIDRAGEALAALPLVVDDAARPTTAYMVGRCLALQSSGPVSLVIFDYLQHTGEKGESRRITFDQALVGLHELAKRLACPVLCLAQLNRELDRRGAGSEPHLSDLKETGGAEEIAALVLMCYHPWTHWYQQGGAPSEEPDRDAFDLFVRKNTHGPLGPCRLYMDRDSGRITDPEEPN